MSDDDDKVTDQAYKPPNSPEQSSGDGDHALCLDKRAESLCTNMTVLKIMSQEQVEMVNMMSHSARYRGRLCKCQCVDI